MDKLFWSDMTPIDNNEPDPDVSPNILINTSGGVFAILTWDDDKKAWVNQDRTECTLTIHRYIYLI